MDERRVKMKKVIKLRKWKIEKYFLLITHTIHIRILRGQPITTSASSIESIHSHRLPLQTLKQSWY